LEEGNIIKRKTGALMLNPELMMRGDEQKQKYLLLEFGNFEQDAEDKQENALSDYYSFKD
uniref:replication/maintenance protein RepL n=1 Tax=Staphylococcus aureus TaxID=1280 RepID=UPI0030F37CFD